MEIGAAATEVGVGEAVDDGVALDVAVTEAGLPVAEVLEGGLAELEGDVPGEVAAFEFAGGGAGVGAAVVDGDGIDAAPVEGDVLGDFTGVGEADGSKRSYSSLPVSVRFRNSEPRP